MNIVPHGLTAHQYGGRVTWVKRRQKFGPSGFSAAGLREMIRHLIGQNDRRKKSLSRRRCRRGHRYDNPVTRQCNACERLRYHAQKCAQIDMERVARARRALIAAHPDNGGSKTALMKALRFYRQVAA